MEMEKKNRLFSLEQIIVEKKNNENKTISIVQLAKSMNKTLTQFEWNQFSLFFF